MLKKAIAKELPHFRKYIKLEVGNGLAGLFSDLGFSILEEYALVEVFEDDQEEPEV